jgi:hypothetical protein
MQGLLDLAADVADPFGLELFQITMCLRPSREPSEACPEEKAEREANPEATFAQNHNCADEHGQDQCQFHEQSFHGIPSSRAETAAALLLLIYDSCQA